MHIYYLYTIGSDNGWSPDRRHAIIWTNAGMLLIGPSGANFIEIFIGVHSFSFKKIYLKMSSGKWRPSCPGLNVLMKPVHFPPNRLISGLSAQSQRQYGKDPECRAFFTTHMTNSFYACCVHINKARSPFPPTSPHLIFIAPCRRPCVVPIGCHAMGPKQRTFGWRCPRGDQQTLRVE